MKKLIMLLICFIMVLSTIPAFGADESYVDYNTCKLVWDTPIDGGTPTGYKVKYGITSGTYTSTYTYANTTTLSVAINVLTLVLETKYYVVVCAYNDTGDGPNSNEVYFTPTTDSLKFIGKPTNLKVNITN